jgi:hypothetical protein
MRNYLAIALVLVLCVASGLCALAVRALTGPGDSTLAGVGAPDVSMVTCQSNTAVHSGPRLSLSSEWLVEADVVTMIGTYQRRGWSPTTFMGTTKSDIKLLPLATEDYDMLVGRVRVYRSVSLSYTADYTTRLVSVTSAVFCPA